MTSASLSIVVPAHNEGPVIESCLRSILEDPTLPSGAEIIVICNGCTDDTAARASSFGVKVLELPEASKARALVLADEEATSFPRLYLDADVNLATGSIGPLVEAVAEGQLLAAAPQLVLDTTGASLLVRLYSAVWADLPEIRGGLAGRGAYVLSEEGRRRFGSFAGVDADDTLVHRLFWPQEGRSVEGSGSIVRSSRRMSDVIRRKRRVFRANLELDKTVARNLDVRTPATARLSDFAAMLRANPGRLAALPVYVAANAAAKVLGAFDQRRGRSGWGSDVASRS